MASKRRSFISLIFIINCITKCSLIRIIIINLNITIINIIYFLIVLFCLKYTFL